jgi:hypothetical protein
MLSALALPLLLAIRLTTGAPGSLPPRQPSIATTGETVGVVWGSGNTIWYASSADGAKTFGKPERIGEAKGKLALGMRRGPRLAMAGGGNAYITAIDGGDVLLWKSTDNGRSWAPTPRRVNDTPNSAREGFQSVAASGRRVLVTWLDLRSTGMKLYSATSDDAGATWSDNRLVYTSPDGHICECCHTSTTIAPDGTFHAMFRNWVDGNRDMYLASSADGGKTWQTARKLGISSWKLEACPMDGGSIAVGTDGQVLTAWRRDKMVYLSVPGQPEQEFAPGKQPVAVPTSRGPVVLWNEGPALRLKAGNRTPAYTLSPAGAFATLAASSDHRVFAAWEENGSIVVDTFDIR